MKKQVKSCGTCKHNKMGLCKELMNGIKIEVRKQDMCSKYSKDTMPTVNPHSSAIIQDDQWRRQKQWLKDHGFKTPEEARDAGY